MEKHTNEYGKECYRGVMPETPLNSMEFHLVIDTPQDNTQWALHTNMGSLTVVDRITGFGNGMRDTETGYRDIEGKFWLASGMNDVRDSEAKTIQEAIDWVKNHANTCIGI